MSQPENLLENSKAFCLMPWVHLHVNTRGRMQACCVGDIPFGNINEASLEEIWQGPEIRQFRLKMLKDEPEKCCRVCYAREAAGATSMRQEVNQQYAHHRQWVTQTDEEGYAPEAKPVYWDIRFSNLCNFRCRTCWHGASSAWFAEAQSLKRTAGKEAVIKAAKEPEVFLHQLKTLLPHVEEIYFAGGEPLLMEEHDQLLAALEQLGKFDIRLRYNTNFSRLDYFGREVMEVWNRFGNVIVGASLDASGLQGEAIRKGQDWNRVIENRKRMKTLCPQVHFEIHPTVSVLNVKTLPAFHREWVEMGLLAVDHIYLNLLERPDFYNIKVLDGAKRGEIRELYDQHQDWLESQNANEQTQERFREVIQFMEAGDISHRWEALLTETERLNELCGENVKPWA